MFRIFSTISIVMLCANVLNAQVYINEWMASNSSVIEDPDFENSGDWIELFNDYNDTLFLEGYFLSDNLNEPIKWAFPDSAFVPPNDFLLLWADGEAIGVHTNFKLTKEGEEIGLYNTDTILVDSVIYPHQATNISMGRTMDGSTSLSFFETPTPGASNQGMSYDGLTFYLPHFSEKGGLKDAALEVSLSAIAGTIRYTTDGSFPDWDDAIYDTPISINTTTILRAAVFIDNHIAGKAVTHSYFYEDDLAERGLPVVSIATNPEYFWDENIGLYVQDFKPEWEYPINIELFENDGSDCAAINELAGTKVNGLNSWELPQKMLGIYFDNDYGNNNLDYQLFFENDRTRFDNFTLRASGSDWSSTLFRDALCQGLTDYAMDLEHMAYRPAIAFVNGEYMGIHNIRSRIDESFIEDNFGYGNNEYDLIENDGEVEEGDAIAFEELFALFDTDLSEASNYMMVDSLMDIANFMDFFITEIWSSNSSWGHNIQLWKPKEAGTKWRWILQDFDRGFSGSTNNDIDYFTTDNNPNGYAWARKPLESMLQNEAFEQQFAQRFTDHLYTSFHPELVQTNILTYKNRLAQEIPHHVDRWLGATSDYGDAMPSVEFWEDEVSELIAYAQERQPFMIDDLQDHFDLEDAANLGVMTFPSQAGQITINTLPIPASNWSGPYFQDMPFELTAVPGVGYEFQGWSTAISEILIPKESSWKYLDDGSDQGVAWQSPSFDDSAWSEGNGQLGYGEGDEATELSFGDDAQDKHITYYFRQSFEVTNLADYTEGITINLLRDDGAVVYINGVEVLRSNMPDGNIDYLAGASDFVGNAAEDTYFSFNIAQSNLVEGANTIAVEIHQFNGTSSDVSFDLELLAIKLDTDNLLSTDATLNVNMQSDTFLIANYELVSNCLLPREVTTNTTLTIDCSPYFAPEDVTVLEGVNLIIEPGVEIHFPPAANMIVHGQMLAQGTENQPILLRSINEDEAWGALIFNNTNVLSEIHWTEIKDASNGIHPIYENAALTAFHANLLLNHLTIEDVFSNPILGYYSDITLTNSNLHSAVTGDLINVKYGTGIVDNCVFIGNEQVDTDAIDYDDVTNGIIANSQIKNFLGFNSDGIDIGEESRDVTIENNFIHNCSDKGISLGQLSSAFIEQNTIVNCNQGIGIKDLATAEIDQNTFYNVALPVASFEKNIGIGGGIAFVSNSILSNSPESPIYVDEFSVLEMEYSLSDTDTLAGFENVFGHAHFASPTYHDFLLQPESAAIGVGLDGFGQTIEVGAKYHDFSAQASLQISAIHYHPADNPNAEFIHLYNPSTEPIDLTGYVISNAITFTFTGGTIAPNETIWLVRDASLFPDVMEQVYEWTSGRLSNEGETIRMTDTFGIIVDQVAYLPTAPWPSAADGEGPFLSLISAGLDNHFGESWMPNEVLDIQSVEAFEWNMYPNPAQNTLHLAAADELIEEVSFINSIGQIIETQHFYANEVQINLNNLASGLWFVRINKQSNGKRLIIMK